MAAATVGWRLLTFNGFTNDQYVHLALAQQLLLGDRPIRDFIDPGEPLMYLVSAATWFLWGNTVVVEWATGVAGFAIGSVFLVLAAARLSGSTSIAILMTVFVVLISPRHYGYPKVLLYAAAGWAIVSVAAAPSRRRIIVLGAIAATAFLFRHDHGFYVAAAAFAAVVLAVEGWRPRAQNAVTLAAGAMVVLLPWMLFVAVNEPMAYLRTAVQFASAESVTLLDTWPRLDLVSAGNLWSAIASDQDNGAAWLFWLYWALPAVGSIVAVRRHAAFAERWPGESAAIVSLAVMAAGVNAGFLRDVLAVRVPDAAVPAALLGAFFLGLAWRRRPRVLLVRAAAGTAALVTLIVTAGAVHAVAGARFERAGLSPLRSPRTIGANLVRATGLLRAHHRDVAPSRHSRALLPFFEYLDRCARSSDRLVINGLFPDILVLAGRGFAGGAIAITRGYLPRDRQADTIERLRSERPSFALLLGDSTPDFRASFGEIDGYLGTEYGMLTEWPVDGTAPIRILMDRARTPNGIDAATGYPCFL